MKTTPLNPSLIVEVDNIFVGGLEQFEEKFFTFVSPTLDGKIREIMYWAETEEYQINFR